MTDVSMINRAALKADLLRGIAALDRQTALLPSDPDDTLSSLITQLEGFNPTPHPLSRPNRPRLLGNWNLLYASRGTVVTRRVSRLPEFLGSITLQQVWQRLSESSGQTVSTENGAVLEIPLLGKWRIAAHGFWRWEPGETQTAKVSFSRFSIQPESSLGFTDWRLPTLNVPILEALRQEAEWTTSYLDDEIRIGRGATGNLFVFQRV